MKIEKASFLRLLIVVFVVTGYVYSQEMKGSGWEYKVKVESVAVDKSVLVDKAIDVVLKKINALGLSGSVSKVPGDSSVFLVRIYGKAILDRITLLSLFTSHQMEIRKVVGPSNPSPVKTYASVDDAKKAATDDQEIFPYSERGDSPTTFVVVEKSVIVNDDDIRDAKAVSISGSANDYVISFTLKPKAAVKFGDWTSKNINNYLAIALDKKIQSIAFIKSQIFESGEIYGRFTKTEAEDIAVSIASGKLPFTLTIIDEHRFGI